ncbi:penicillin-binding protein 1A [Gammaproteobacteria bacterium]|nr:penicillin-binding protein 1A [Gammaproteobacteria bacterium]
MSIFFKRALKPFYYFIGLIFASLLALYITLSSSLPSVEEIQDMRMQIPMRIYTQDKKLIAVFGEKKRIPVTFEEIPDNLKNAFIAAEDNRFYNHNGVDYFGLLRALKSFLTTGKVTQGGSTITMQVARNFYLTREKKIIRKLREILLAYKLERNLSKERIFELYMNKIYLGHRAYGVAAAAQVYYGKRLSELNLSQTAMIAGLPKAPSRYNPIANKKRALQRRDYVLRRMSENNFISQDEYINAYLEPVSAKLNTANIELKAPYVSEMARIEMEERFGKDAYTKGYDVFTTINSKLQEAAQSSLKKNIEKYDIRHGYRGPEAKINYNQLLNSDFEYDLEISMINIDKYLKNFYEINKNIPAVVLNVEKKIIKVYTKNNQLLDIKLNEVIIKNQYFDVNYRKKIKSFDKILSIGDVVRVKEVKNKWRLSQIPNVNGALVSIDSNSGAISALSGGYDYRLSKFNRVLQAKRQPGSSFKPFIYSAALNKGYTPASVINDAPKVFKENTVSGAWRPKNYGGKFFGPTRLRYGLAKSRNMISIRLLDSIGINYTLNYVKNFGVKTEKLPKDLTLALGSGEITPIELSEAYAYFSNGGFGIKPYIIEQVRKRNNEIIYVENPVRVCGNPCDYVSMDTLQFPSAESVEEITELRKKAGLPRFATQTVDPRNIYQMVSMMKDVVKYGTARKAKVLKRDDIAGKTGTTNDQKDAWFTGFNRDIVTVSFLGFDNHSSLGKNEFGSTAALPMWVDYMKIALKGTPKSNMDEPEGLVSAKIDSKNGLLASPNSESSIVEVFRKENVPKTFSKDIKTNDENQKEIEIEKIF